MWTLLRLCWGLLWYCYGSYCCGLAVWVLWLLEGIALTLLWFCCENAFALLRYCCGIDVRFCGIDVEFPTVLLGDCSDIMAVVLLWHSCECWGLLLYYYHYSIAVGWLGYCCDLAVGFLRLLRDCCMGCWDCCGMDVEFLWDWYGNFLYHCLGLLWYPYGIAVWFLWGLLGYSWGIVGRSLWYYFGISVGMLWYCCDIAMGFLWVALRILGSLWLLDCYGKVLKRWWDNFINLARFPFHAKTGLYLVTLGRCLAI